jgi:hypothetical protein
MRLSIWLFVVFAFLLAGCKKEPSLVGKWTGDLYGFDAALEFKPDNTVTASGNVGGYAVLVDGVYKLEAKNLTITPRKLETKDVPEAFKGIVDGIKKDIVNKPFGGEIEFKTDDEVTIKLTAAPGAKPTKTAPQTATLVREKAG